MTKPRSHTFQAVHDIFFLECDEYISNTKDEERINTYHYPEDDYVLKYITEYTSGTYHLEQVDKIQLQYNYKTRYLRLHILYHDSHIDYHTIHLMDVNKLYNITFTPTRYTTKE